jgi:hypothetical protein
VADGQRIKAARIDSQPTAVLGRFHSVRLALRIEVSPNKRFSFLKM